MVNRPASGRDPSPAPADGAAGDFAAAGRTSDDGSSALPASRREGRVFDATLALERRELDGATLAGALAAHPFMTAKVVAMIHWQALKLWFKRTPFHVHPAKAQPKVQTP
jgi:DUF1365 family protein